MFTHYAKIYLRDTDASGVIYFTEKLRLALQAFEAFIAEKGINFSDMIEKGDYLFPIVHAEADYFAPLKVGDSVQITLTVLHTGKSSFTLKTEMFNEKKVHVGSSKIIHVVTSRKTMTSTPIPETLLELLHSLEQDA